MAQPKILSLDPGGETGWFMFDTFLNDDVPFKFTGGTLLNAQHHIELENLLNQINPGAVICERFDHWNNDFSELISCEYIGIVKLWCKSRGIPLLSPGSHEMAWASNDKLEAVGWLKRPLHPNRHQNDAARHMLQILAASKQKAVYFNPSIRHGLLQKLKELTTS